uniref:Uncharacterized protein n=1 Tax=Stomoxys calcitrans TaxID=35570 RepID=A0A1I8NZN9_STOCA
MFIVMGVTFAIYVCFSTMTSFLAEPTVTTLDPQVKAIWDVPFPSIAVCSKNKLSRRAMKEYSENITTVPRLTSDISLVKIYYDTPYGTKYQKNVLYNWFQILSNIGGVIGISMGCSLISGFEIIYFGIVRLVENYLKFRALRR